MQSLAPLSPRKLLASQQNMAMRFEVHDGTGWVDLSQVAPANEAFLDVEIDEWLSATAPSKWNTILGGTSTVNRDGTTYYSGTYAARIDVDASNSLAYFWQNVNLPPLYRYTLSFYYKTAAGKNAAFYMRNIQTTRYLNGAGAWQAGAVAITLPEATAWTLYELEILTDYDGYSYNCSFASGSSSASSSIWFDKLSLAPFLNYLKGGTVQVAGAGRSSEPLAGSWSASLNNDEGIFHPYHTTSDYADLIRIGRKARLSLGVLSRDMVRFHGDQYIQVEHDADLNITGEITIEAWVKQTFRDSWATLVTKGISTGWGGHNYVLGLQSGRPDFRWGAAGSCLADVGNALPAGEWHHVVAVAETGTTGALKLYIDGAEVKAATRSGSPATNASPLRFGSDDGFTDDLNGAMSEVRIYSRALTAAEVAEHYRHAYQSETGLVGLWAFDESGPIAYDGSGNALDGRLEGAWRSWPELFANPGLERWASATDCSGWVEQKGGTNTIDREATEVHGSTYSAKLTSVNSTTCNLYQSGMSLKAGHLHRLSFWYKSATGMVGAWVYGGASFAARLERGARGELVWGTSGANIYFDAASDWTYGELVFRAHEDHQIYLVSVGLNDAGAGHTMYLDDLSLVDLEEGREVLERCFWPRIVGYMDNPSFNHREGSLAISGTDYMKALADVRLYDPYTAWGAVDTFDAVPSPGGTGSEIYTEGDACEIGAGELNNVTGWSAGGGATLSSSTPGNGSSYFLRLERNIAGDESATNVNVGTLVAGTTYVVKFDGRGVVDSGGTAKLQIHQTVSGGFGLLQEVEIAANIGWQGYSAIVQCTSAGACKLVLTCSGEHPTLGDVWSLDNISIKNYDTESWATYELDPACNGVYRVTLDDEPVWQGEQDGEGGWHYHRATNTLQFTPGMTVNAGTGNLKIYYYTSTAPEDMVADLLMAAGLYASRAAAKAAMDYVATGVLIERPWMEQGITELEAVKMICERLNYRFWFAYDGTPTFKPAPMLASPAHLTLEDEAAVGDMALYQDIDEVRNRVIVEGEERSVLNVSTKKVERSTWKGEVENATSIAAYLEKTYAINNHLFQDQDAVDDMAALILASYKDPKYYLDLSMPISAVPLEIGDTLGVEIPLSSSLSVTKKALIRAIDLQDFDAKYLCEVFMPTNTALAVNDANLAMAADSADVARTGYIDPEEAALAMTADQPDISLHYVYDNGADDGELLTIPSNITSAVIECWGCGGTGGDSGVVYGGGGAGGGAYSKKTLTVEATKVLRIRLGEDGDIDSYVEYNGTGSYVTACLARKGDSGSGTNGGQGGAAASGTGDTKYSGGNGASSSSSAGGGAGSSAGPGSNGNNASGQSGASAPTGGGEGGDGGDAYSDGSAGTAPGGGGGGAGMDDVTTKYGGAGAIGLVKITLT